MAIYRPRRSPLPALAAAGVAGILIGLFAGWLAWANQPPDLEEAAAVVSSGLADAAGLVEVATIEYREAAADGEVTDPTEFRGARDAMARARQRYDEVGSGLRALAPDRATSIEAGFADLDGLLDDLAPADTVDAAAADLRELLSGAT